MGADPVTMRICISEYTRLQHLVRRKADAGNHGLALYNCALKGF